MRQLKVVGLLATAAIVVTALFGAGSASADVLCKATPNSSGECATTSGDYASGETYTLKSTNPVFTVVGSGIAGQVTCEESNMSLKSTSTGSNTPGGAPVPTSEITSLSFTFNCKTDTGIGCTVSTSSGYNASLRATNDKGSGTFLYKGTRKTRVVCGGFFVCEYEPTVAGVDFAFTGGNPAKIVATAQELAIVPGGIGCGTDTFFDATYTYTGANAAVWVATKNA